MNQIKIIKAVEMPQTVIDIIARCNRPGISRAVPPCFCANTLEQVESAWGLVYDRYAEMGLIGENPYHIHVAPTVVGPDTCVIWGPEGPDIGYTMTALRDNPAGLALDSVYASDLDKLRRDGRRLLEVGMLADRRRHASRSIGALFGMMRSAVYFALHTGLTDVVIGVHPRHVQFYVRCYGFEQFAAARDYPLVRNHPVVPLRLRLVEKLAEDTLPRGLAHARNNPLGAQEFAQRFTFEPKQLRGSRIAAYVDARDGTVRPPKPAAAAVPVAPIPMLRLGHATAAPAVVPA